MSTSLSTIPQAAEEWRTIPGSEGLYSVSDLGRVRSEPIQTSRLGRQRGRILRCCPGTKGYLQFRLCRLDGRQTTTKVHRVVALAFLGPRPLGAQINHKSGNKLDNSVSNLEYVTCRQNIRHAWRIGLYSRDHMCGERSHRARLTAEDVRHIRSPRANTSLAELARQFGVTKSTVSQVIKRKTWKHVA
jgi:hypothetical protein